MFAVLTTVCLLFALTIGYSSAQREGLLRDLIAQGRDAKFNDGPYDEVVTYCNCPEDSWSNAGVQKFDRINDERPALDEPQLPQKRRYASAGLKEFLFSNRHDVRLGK